MLHPRPSLPNKSQSAELNQSTTSTSQPQPQPQPQSPPSSLTKADPNLQPASLHESHNLNFFPPSLIQEQLEMIEKDPKFISLLTCPSKQQVGNKGPRYNDLYRQVLSKPTYYYNAVAAQSYQQEAETTLTGYGYQLADSQPDFQEVFNPEAPCSECGKHDSTVHIFYFTNQHICDSCRSLPQFGISYKTYALKDWKLRAKDLTPLIRQVYPKSVSSIPKYKTNAFNHHHNSDGKEIEAREPIVRSEIYFWRDLRWAKAMRTLEDREKQEKSLDKQRVKEGKNSAKANKVQEKPREVGDGPGIGGSSKRVDQVQIQEVGIKSQPDVQINNPDPDSYTQPPSSSSIETNADTPIKPNVPKTKTPNQLAKEEKTRLAREARMKLMDEVKSEHQEEKEKIDEG